ncbi:MmgE/PrpD family protein [Actinomadura mexicana]|uniref:MmgE/PrpD family protein n=1 Tax=Actinomadura mexicana TaxID=134959 RepID=A0A238XC02_9ACTN|nr:MmgE/PrpD family protein [Actinomadura mexicana]SNR56091.1 MmgE/PrpD family protein [Actinomadura mexicana]
MTGPDGGAVVPTAAASGTGGSVEDPCLTLWRCARDGAEAADAAALERAAGCLAVAIADMVVSARAPRHRSAAAALAGPPGACTVSGSPEGAAMAGAVLANAYLMHARLTDDSFRVAAHPGLAVVPVVLAALEEATRRTGRAVDGERVLRAVVGGYECACRLADRLLPEVSRRGWRVTSVIAPLAAAATMALTLDLPEEDACAALGLASSASGGPLGVVSTAGDAWRLQPALAVQAGVSAAVAATAGLRGGAGALTGPHGLYELFGDGTASLPKVREPAVLRVTFKRHPVAMYGQSIFDAFQRRPPVSGSAERIVVRLAPFAAGYGNQRDASAESISSVEGITLAAVRAFHPGLRTSEASVEVVGDPARSGLTARIDVVLSDGRRLALAGDGDTSGWKPADFDRHCTALLGELGGPLFRTAAAVPEQGGVSRLLAVWRAAR